MNITSSDLRKKFLEYFEKRGHKILPSSSLVPENDSSVLFTTAGMQQFKRYYLFPDETPSTRITTCQKCLRTGDIDEVGDETHLTFFEMLGNFSFGYPKKEGSYFKEEAIKMAWEFLTEELEISKDRITVAYFKGEKEIPADDKTLGILKNIIGLSDDKIKGTGKDETFWSLGTEGSPGGPTVEFYIDGIEVWNLVFNQYVLRDGNYIPSEYQGVDTGMGIERLLAVLKGEKDTYKNDLLQPIIGEIEKVSNKKYFGNEKEFRIIADHTKAAVSLIYAGVNPSNIGRGYVLRRLIRRARRKFSAIGIKFDLSIIQIVCEIYGLEFSTRYSEIFDSEVEKYSTPLGKVSQYKIDLEQAAENEVIKKIKDIPILSAPGVASGTYVYENYQTYGVPPELSIEVAKELRLKFDEEGFYQASKTHQNLSRTASAGMFNGGLADNDPRTTRLHTAAHLLLAGLRKFLGENVVQKGSNIISERLRFDFNYPEKLSKEQIAKVENFVNDTISKNAKVKMEEMTLDEAKQSGAHGVFDDRYGEKVRVFTISVGENIISREICGGPHVDNVSELGHFKITKEESSSSGIRRVKAILE